MATIPKGGAHVVTEGNGKSGWWKVVCLIVIVIVVVGLFAALRIRVMPTIGGTIGDTIQNNKQTVSQEEVGPDPNSSSSDSNDSSDSIIDSIETKQANPPKESERIKISDLQPHKETPQPKIDEGQQLLSEAKKNAFKWFDNATSLSNADRVAEALKKAKEDCSKALALKADDPEMYALNYQIDEKIDECFNNAMESAEGFYSLAKETDDPNLRTTAINDALNTCDKADLFKPDDEQIKRLQAKIAELNNSD